LYNHFDRIFLDGCASNEVTTACGHTIKIFDHHFFHLVKLDHPNKPQPLKMANEKSIILSTTTGFGEYTYDRQRALYLESAMACLACPDEVWEDPTLRSAKWVYLKFFDTTPYSCTIMLVGERRREGLVPVTSFPGKGGDIRRKRRGVRIYP
jgi:phage-Barnase-EndoU-ColicinE5/D-RelE like nuclease2